ncbi:transposase [Paraburkholderia heleia]|uniref:transposase n=1 Tax=Paraburkholderia heleia TaxID=634127 RepID=UPI002AB6DEF1|nr:transposase [Paraburkholderia heleia]
MISAITNRGALSFMVFEGKFKNATFIEFMKRLIKGATRKVYLIVDGHPVHRSKAARRFVAENASAPDSVTWVLPRIEPGRAAQSGCENQRARVERPTRPN